MWEDAWRRCKGTAVPSRTCQRTRISHQYVSLSSLMVRACTRFRETLDWMTWTLSERTSDSLTKIWLTYKNAIVLDSNQERKVFLNVLLRIEGWQLRVPGLGVKAASSKGLVSWTRMGQSSPLWSRLHLRCINKFYKYSLKKFDPSAYKEQNDGKRFSLEERRVERMRTETTVGWSEPSIAQEALQENPPWHND